MILQRLIWSGLAVALAVGTVQTGVQRFQAAPLILAAEVYEEQRAEVVEAPALITAQGDTVAAPAQAAGVEEAHEHDAAQEWEPEDGAERIGWTWVANVLHAFSMAILVLAVMGVWLYQRGTAASSMRVGGLVAAAGWLSFYFWPSLGLPAEVPGMDAAPLHGRQLWWVLAWGCALAACGVVAFARAGWRWFVAAALLAVPFVVGAPHLQGDHLAGYGPEARAALEQLGQQFIWATAWVSLTFWVFIGLASGWVFQRWVRPALEATLNQSHPVGRGATQAGR